MLAFFMFLISKTSEPFSGRCILECEKFISFCISNFARFPKTLHPLKFHIKDNSRFSSKLVLNYTVKKYRKLAIQNFQKNSMLLKLLQLEASRASSTPLSFSKSRCQNFYHLRQGLFGVAGNFDIYTYRKLKNFLG